MGLLALLPAFLFAVAFLLGFLLHLRSPKVRVARVEWGMLAKFGDFAKAAEERDVHGRFLAMVRIDVQPKTGFYEGGDIRNEGVIMCAIQRGVRSGYAESGADAFGASG